MPGLFDTPTLGPCKVTLWPYQEEAVDAVGAEFRKGVRSTLLSLCTGAGKTMIAAMIVRKCVEKDRKCLFLAHTSELIEQTADKFDLFGIEPGVEQAGQFARSMFDAQAVVGSVQTMMQPGRLASWPTDYFDYVIVDEGHRSLSDSYKRIMAHFRKARILVMTATPVRTDGQAIDYVCESLAYKFSIRDAWRRGKQDGRQYICDIRRVIPDDLGIDPGVLRRSKADITDRHYDARLAVPMEVLCNYIRGRVEGRQTIQFWPTIRCAQLAAEGQRGYYPSDAVWGQDPCRKDKIKSYRDGDIRMLANQELFREGFDVPNTSAIVLGRSTNSWSMMLQQIGRGLRAGKSECLVLDLWGLTERFGDTEGYLVQPAEIDGTPGFYEEAEEIRRELAAIRKKEPELSLMNAIEQAEEDVERRRKRKQYAVRIAIAERYVACAENTYHDMKLYEEGSVGPAARAAPVSDFKPATDGQKRYLRFLGFGDEVERWSKGRAGTAISYAKRQREAGKSTIWQRTKLARNGVEMGDARDMSKEQADAAIAERWEGTRQHV